ncbi:protein phosphatase 1 regulatory subunit 12A [Nephila pilipes]|uniref:Protein phosphatase 1 regulatory subunit 12B n=1 Tax=Nephila pilipes TaxID=299642 RepID=A0A8X6UKX5_NEPPI|nr:protein phosphatase 1 regulatory subunit 12A [Nephila pilipes]
MLFDIHSDDEDIPVPPKSSASVAHLNKIRKFQVDSYYQREILPRPLTYIPMDSLIYERRPMMFSRNSSIFLLNPDQQGVRFRDEDIFLDACINTNKVVAGILLKKGVDIINCCNSIGETALHNCLCFSEIVFMPIETRSNSALFRRAEQLKRWEESETNNVPATIPKDKKSKIKFSDGCVFLAACAASDTEEVERLLKQGTDINTANVDGLTALHQACIDNNLEMVQFLVEHGCDVNRGDNEGWTPLHATASCGFISIAKYLIEHGANVAAVNNDGDLPFDIAESAEMEEYLSDVLDEKEIDCDDARSEEERIMLEDAKLMAESAIDINEKIHLRTGATPLHVAAAKGYSEVMKILIQAGVDLNAQDNDGWTPLHAAAHWCQKEACALLADSLANMDIQTPAGQTCFDVADPDIVKLLEELKKKQASMQKDRPEIQAILQRTSNRPPLKRRTSVTRMSGHEKSKSVMKDTKSERAQIENLTLPEEENEEDKEKRQNASIELFRTQPVDKAASGKPLRKPNHDISESPLKKESEEERIPSWKKVLRRAAEESTNSDSNVSEVILKRPKKLNEDNKEKADDAGSKDGRPTISPVRDDESELQRKAHAKRVRETRRSTQGVLLEDIKSAELQFLINTQQEAAKRQAEEAEKESLENNKTDAAVSGVKESKQDSAIDSKEKDSHSSKTEKPEISSQLVSESRPSSDANSTENAPSVTLSLRPKSTSSPEDTSPSDSRTSLGTQAAIQRRRRPKRRSTGVVYLDSDEAPEEKDNTKDKDYNSTHEPVGL